MIPRALGVDQRTDQARARALVGLLALVVAFLAQGLLFALHLVPWDSEWGYITLGRMAIEGQIALFQDEMLGERMPLPYYFIGLSQLAGPSLLAARVASLAIGTVAIVLTFAAAGGMAGPACGLLAAGFLATHGVVVGYFAVGSYFAFCAALTAGGLAALTTVARPWGGVLCMACFVAVAFARANLAVMAPFVCAYLVWTATTRGERLAVLATCAGPAIAFFAWSTDHWKVLAYVPVLDRLVLSLGYQSNFALGARELFPRGTIGRGVLTFARMYFFWLVMGVVLGLAWIATRNTRPAARERGAPHAVFCAALAIWTLAWQVVILRGYPKSVAAWTASFAPVWAVVLAWAVCLIIVHGRASAPVRGGVAAAVAVVFLIGPSRPRHAAMPTPLPPLSTVAQVDLAAQAIRKLIPSNEDVFVLGSPLAPYLAGTRPYLRQSMHPATLVPSLDSRAVSRSGAWGAVELERWLGREARYAIIDPKTAEGFRAIEAYRPLVARLSALLENGFELAGTIAQGDSVSLVYRRRQSVDARGPS